MTNLVWFLLGFLLALPIGVLAGYVWADRRSRHVPLFPHPLNSDEEHA